MDTIKYEMLEGINLFNILDSRKMSVKIYDDFKAVLHINDNVIISDDLCNVAERVLVILKEECYI